MQKIYFLLFLSILFASAASAQDTMVLTLRDDANRIVLKFGNKILKPEGNQLPASKQWIFRIENQGTRKYEVSVSDGLHEFTLPDLKKEIVVSGNVFGGSQVETDQALDINVKEDSLVRKFSVSFVGGISSNTTKNSSDAFYKSGCMVRDAIYLAEGNDVNAKMKILGYYAHENTSDGIKAAYADNLLVKDLLKDLLRPAVAQGVNYMSILQSVFPAVGGMDVTAEADGFARFLVKRTKEELAITFFKKLGDALAREPDLKTLFPETTGLLAAIGNDIYNFEKYVQNIQEAHRHDLLRLSQHLPGIIENHPTYFNEHHTEAAALKTGGYLVNALQEQGHPGDVIAGYPLEFLHQESKDLQGSIQLLQLFSASLRDTGANGHAYWVSMRTLQQLTENRKSFKYFLGLIAEKALIEDNKIAFDKGNFYGAANKLATVLDTSESAGKAYSDFILQFERRLTSIELVLENYRKSPADSTIFDKYRKYSDTFIELVGFASSASKLPYMHEVVGNPGALQDKISFFTDIISSLSDLSLDISKENYSSAVNHAVLVYQKIISEPFTLGGSPSKNDLKIAFAASPNTESALYPNKDTLPVSPQKVENASDLKSTLAHLVQYGSFMATFAQAKNSEEAETAIEAAALPSGSARIKRESNLNIALNAYLGLYVGYERIRGVDAPYSAGKFNSFGLTAPVGISVSWGKRKLWVVEGNGHWSYSFFASLVDLGNIAAFRFRNDSVSSIPVIKLQDIISPGGFISIGIPETPLSINVGAQMGPRLRNVHVGGNDFSKDTYIRYSISLVVDIPVFNFYNKVHP